MKLPTLEEIKAEQAKRSLKEFVRQAWPIVEPSIDLLENWHIDAICDHLEAVTQGEIKRLLINIPPRYMKSTLVTIMWPCWEWITKPGLRYLFASYSADMSTEHSLARRTIIESPWYQSRYGHIVALARDQNEKTAFRNTARGLMVATSVGGTATGKGGERVIVDDPHNVKQAESEVERNAAVTFFRQTLSTRLNDKAKDAIVVVMQRLHQADVSGYCIGAGYTHLCLPGEYEPNHPFVWPKDPRKEPGELLWPRREDAAVVAEMKSSLGSYGFAGQYQQRPSPAEGGVIKREWIRYYNAVPVDATLYVQSWDATFKDTQDGSYVVGQVWAKKGADYYLVDQVRGRWDFVRTVQEIKNLTARYPQARSKLIEDKANGPAIISALRHEVSGLIPIQVKGSKEARLAAVSPLFEAGNVHLPGNAPWVADYIEELCSFPNAANDDQADSTSQALDRLSTKLPVRVAAGGERKDVQAYVPR